MIKGSDRALSLSDLLQLLANSGSTGSLVLAARDESRTLIIREGTIRSVHGFEGDGRGLGELMFSRRQIGFQRWKELCLRAEEENSPVEVLLLREEILDKAELLELLTYQVLERICDLFTWEDASWRVMPVAREAESLPVTLNTEATLMEAARRHDEWMRLWDRFGGRDAIVRVCAGREADLAGAFGSSPAFDSGLILRRRTIGEILTDSRHRQMDAAAVLLSLYDDGVIEPLPGEDALELLANALVGGDAEVALGMFLHCLRPGESQQAVLKLLDPVLGVAGLADVSAGRRLTMRCEGISVIELLATLSHRRIPAVLHITDSGKSTWIRTGEGQLAVDAEDREIFADVSPMSRLALQLHESGIRSLVAQCRRSGESIASCIRERGILTAEELRQTMQALVTQEIQNLVFLDHAQVELVFGHPPELDAAIGATAAVLRLDETQEETLCESLSGFLQQARAMPCVDVVLQPTAEQPSASAPVAKLLSTIDGACIARHLLDESRLPNRVAYRLLTEALAEGSATLLDEGGLTEFIFELVEGGRPADALRLCRGARMSHHGAEALAEVEAALIEEHGDLLGNATRHAFEGDLRGVALAPLIASLGAARRAGTLRISGSQGESQEFYFEGGDILIIHQDGADEIRSLKLEIAIRRGVVNPAEIPEHLRRVVLRYLDVTFWVRPRFTFTAGHYPEDYLNPGEGMTKVRHSMDHFLMQIATFEVEESSLRDSLAAHRVFKFRNPFTRVRAAREVGHDVALKLIDGTRSLAAIARQSGVEMEALEAVVAQLSQRDLLVETGVAE